MRTARELAPLLALPPKFHDSLRRNCGILIQPVRISRAQILRWGM